MGAAPPTVPVQTSPWLYRSTTATTPGRWTPPLPPSSSSAAPGNHDGNPRSGFVKKGHTCKYAGETMTRGQSWFLLLYCLCLFVSVFVSLFVFLFVPLFVSLFVSYFVCFFLTFFFSFFLASCVSQGTSVFLSVFTP